MDFKDKKAKEHGVVANSHNAMYAIRCAHYENDRLFDGQSPQIFHVVGFVGKHQKPKAWPKTMLPWLKTVMQWTKLT